MALALRTPSPVIPVGASYRLRDGTPVRNFIRYIVQVGKQYKKPPSPGVRGWSEPLVVDERRARHWLSQWKVIRDAGVSVKITKNHADRNRAENIMGDVVDLYLLGDWIACLHTVRGQKNIDMAEANKDVSPEITPELRDSHGHVWKDVIAAVSYVGDPVVTHQPEELAASLSAGEATVEEYRLSVSAGEGKRVGGYGWDKVYGDAAKPPVDLVGEFLRL